MKWPKISLQGTETKKDSSMSTLNWFSIIVLLLGIIIVLLFGVNYTSKATIFVWMLACLLTGTAIGFLFGIPKILQANQNALLGNVNSTNYQQQVNTNLTEISDWLTKIIVGLGLVNLIKIPPYLSKIANILASGLSQPTKLSSTLALAFSYGTIVSYIIFGFLFGYLTTRLYLAGAFSEADQTALQLIYQQSEEAVGAAKSALQKAEFALIKPSTSIQGADQVPEEKIQQLAQAYNQTRSSMPSGTPRTAKMAKIVKDMTIIIPSLTTFDVTQALDEKDNGKRLIAYAYLYVKPNYQYLEKLVDAFTSDSTPFGQYWGIQALGKILEYFPNEKINSRVFSKLKAFYDQLDKGIDREYELSRLLPDLKK